MNTIRHVTVVPIPMALDEHGIVRYPRFRNNRLDEFLGETYPKPSTPAGFNVASAPNIDALRSKADSSNDAADWRALGEAVFNFGKPSDLSDAVAALEKAVELDASNGMNQFALGAALRRRYEGPLRRVTDAQAAVGHWGRALDAQPNHYIFRRRIQQYGPRLDKPYNFYFWVEQAREEILARGEQPHPLTAEPMGSEVLARPGRGERAAEIGEIENPDPDGRINRDKDKLVGVETMVTPARVRPGNMVRARVTFRLNEETLPFWNNEADYLKIWIDLPEGLTLGENQLFFEHPLEPETRELRQLEFEVAVDATMKKGKVELPAYAVYYVCEDEGGVCYYLRQDFKIVLEIDPNAPTIK